MKFRFKLRFRPLANPLQLIKHWRSQKRRKITWRDIGRWCLWGLGGFLLLVIFLFAWYAKDLPTPGRIKSRVSESSTRLFDRNMVPLYTISGEKKRMIIEEADMPASVREATISLEDRNFYNHFGISFRGILRAAFFDIFSGSRSQGGSTITQQLVKNALLTKDRTWSRKIKEAILAIELEILYSKDQILTMYLNEIGYGGNNYGIEAASRAYFNKAARDLTLDEAATLAALPQAPTTYSPYGQHLDRLLARRNLALDSMVEMGYISRGEADAAKEKPMAFVPRHDSIVAPHFVLYVKDWLVNYFTEELGDSQLAEQKVEEGGLTVVTTLDINQQKIAEDVVSQATEKTLAKAGASNAGLVAIDPKRGEVIAMVGSVDYFNEKFGSYNITTARRQPGSSFKPIVYAASFKEKYNPAFTLYDVRTDFGDYSPDNYDGSFRGPVSIRYALGNSLNLPAVKVLGLIGLDKALSTASDLGITTLTDKDRYGLSLVLGGGEVMPLEMATAYGVFANGGKLIPTTPVLKIADTDEKVIYDRTEVPEGKQVLDPQVAYEITNILADPDAKKPTFSRTMNVLTLGKRPVAVKTGTTNGYRDAWTIGYTPQLSTAVWAGNNDNSAMNHASGSMAAAPLWHDFMNQALANLPAEEFSKPNGIKTLEVDKLSNKLPNDRSERISDIFASWQVPNTQDDVHVQVRVCREDGLLADGNISDEIAENRWFNNIHSEKPDNPNWEGPVIAWAKANGLYNPPPTASCQSANNNPSVQITEPANGATAASNFTVTASASAPSGVRSVEFFVDNVSVATDNDSPYSTVINVKQLSNGSHTIKVVVLSNSGSSASSQISVTVNRDTTPPGNPTNLNGAVGPGQMTLTWTNPVDADLSLVRIYLYLDLTGVLVRTVDVTKPIQNTTLSGLVSHTAYRVTAKSVDTSNNESSGTTIILTTP